MHSSFLAQRSTLTQSISGVLWPAVFGEGEKKKALAFHIYTVCNVSDPCLPGTLKVKRILLSREEKQSSECICFRREVLFLLVSLMSHTFCFMGPDLPLL